MNKFKSICKYLIVIIFPFNCNIYQLTADPVPLSNLIWNYECEQKSCALSKSTYSGAEEEATIAFFFKVNNSKPESAVIAIPSRHKVGDEFTITWLSETNSVIKTEKFHITKCDNDLCTFVTQDIMKLYVVKPFAANQAFF